MNTWRTRLLISTLLLALIGYLGMLMALPEHRSKLLTLVLVFLLGAGVISWHYRSLLNPKLLKLTHLIYQLQIIV